jgi:antibiotic biosynthesis monooxygenase
VYLTLAIHTPKPEHADDLLDAMTRLRAAADGLPGLVAMGGWRDLASGRVFAMSLWESEEAGQASWASLGPLVADVPFEEWEERPPEIYMGLRDEVTPRLRR